MLNNHQHNLIQQQHPGSCTELEHKGFRFVITERPSDTLMTTYIDEMKRYGVLKVVRVCEPTYDQGKLENNGISVVDLAFPDGQPPPKEIVTTWLQLLKDNYVEYYKSTRNKASSGDNNGTESGGGGGNKNSATTEPVVPAVAVHCVAGLGRAPVLVAIALMELGVKYEDAVETIRSRRRGAINAKQLQFLNEYKAKGRLKIKLDKDKSNGNCRMT